MKKEGLPFSSVRESVIAAMADADLGETSVAPINDWSEHRANLPFEIRRPPLSRLGIRLEPWLQIEGRPEIRISANGKPRFSYEHRSCPSLLDREPWDDVGEYLWSQSSPIVHKRFFFFFLRFQTWLVLWYEFKVYTKSFVPTRVNIFWPLILFLDFWITFISSKDDTFSVYKCQFRESPSIEKEIRFLNFKPHLDYMFSKANKSSYIDVELCYKIVDFWGY